MESGSKPIPSSGAPKAKAKQAKTHGKSGNGMAPMSSSDVRSAPSYRSADSGFGSTLDEMRSYLDRLESEGKIETFEQECARRKKQSKKDKQKAPAPVQAAVEPEVPDSWDDDAEEIQIQAEPRVCAEPAPEVQVASSSGEGKPQQKPKQDKSETKVNAKHVGQPKAAPLQPACTGASDISAPKSLAVPVPPTPAKWDDLVTTALHKAVSGFNVVDVGAGGALRTYGAERVHIMNPVILRSDTVREAFSPMEDRVAKYDGKKTLSYCKHTLSKCTCSLTADPSSVLVFNQSAYYLTGDDLDSIGEHRMFIVADMGEMRGHPTCKGQIVGGEQIVTDKDGYEMYRNPDPAWLLLERRCDEVTYYPERVVRVGDRVLIRAVTKRNAPEKASKADPPPPPQQPAEVGCFALLKEAWRKLRGVAGSAANKVNQKLDVECLKPAPVVRPDGVAEDKWEAVRTSAERYLNREMLSAASATEQLTNVGTALNRRYNVPITVAGEIARATLPVVRYQMALNQITAVEDHDARFYLGNESVKINKDFVPWGVIGAGFSVTSLATGLLSKVTAPTLLGIAILPHACFVFGILAGCVTTYTLCAGSYAYIRGAVLQRQRFNAVRENTRF